MRTKPWPVLVFLAQFVCGAADTVVRTETVPVFYRAIGTVKPTHEADVMAQASGRLITVSVGEGDNVKAGQALATVEDRELALRLFQAQRGVDEAEARKLQAEQAKLGAVAALAQAESEHERVKTYLTKGVATEQNLEEAEAAYRQRRAAAAGSEQAVQAAEAAVQRAEAAVEEAQVARGYAQVVAPFDGVVVKRDLDPGDLAWPGRPLFRLMDPRQMRLEAYVREGLVGQVRLGQKLTVDVDAVDRRLEGVVEEIVPASDQTSRTFTVKVRLPTTPGLVAGMFGRLRIPVGERRAVLVPDAAITRLGQLQTVKVRSLEGEWILRLVRTGHSEAGTTEILSGLTDGETVRTDARGVSP